MSLSVSLQNSTHAVSLRNVAHLPRTSVTKTQTFLCDAVPTRHKCLPQFMRVSSAKVSPFVLAEQSLRKQIAHTVFATSLPTLSGCGPKNN